MKLNYKKIGEGNDSLIIIHGLYGSSDNWLTIAKLLLDKFTIYLIDQRNHGKSPHSEEMNYEVMAQDLLEFMESNAINKSNILGHSMGGKTAMRFALKYPEKVNKLVIVDIVPKSYGLFSNYAKITNDHQLIVNALLSIEPEEYATRSQIDKDLQNAIPNTMVRSFLLKNIGRNGDKTLYWKLNVKAIKNNLQAIMEGFSDLTSAFVFPTNKDVIFISGENSPYVQDEDMKDIRKFFPSAQLTTISNAGHWVHAEQTEDFIKTLNYFID